MNKPWLSKGNDCFSHDSHHSLLPVCVVYLCVYSLNVHKDNMEANAVFIGLSKDCQPLGQTKYKLPRKM